MVIMERELLNKKIGHNIRKYRLQADLSQETLALSAGLYPAYVGRLERGEKCPTIDTLYKICDAINISVCELLTFDGSNSTDTEVILRIEKALERLPDSKHIKIAEIIENLADIMSDTNTN